MTPATPPAQAAAPTAAPPGGYPGWTGPAPTYAPAGRVRRRPSGLELAGDVIALFGMIVLIVDYWADWWVLLVFGLFLLVVGLALYVVAWSQRQRAQPVTAYAPPYQPPAQR